MRESTTKIYYAISPTNSIVTGYTRYANKGDSGKIYELVMGLIGNHKIATDASSWCELAAVGEVYYGGGFKIEIIED